MANPIKQLFGQTAVYGMGIVLPRFLNFIVLTPFYTRVLPTEEYGIITELYAYVVFLLVVLTYGMETGFFRFASNSNEKEKVYTSVLTSVFTTSILFVLLIVAFLKPISNGMGYGDYPNYIMWLVLIVAIDAFTAIPFARIRLLNKPIKYTLIRIAEVVVNVGLILFFLSYAPRHLEDQEWIGKIYNESMGVGYVLIANLAASALKMILLSGEILASFRGSIDIKLLKIVLKYSYPLLIAGLAGAVNEALDRVLLKHLLDPADNPMSQLGIYGANFKIAVLMSLFVQMFRYAAEPFFFSKSNEKNAKGLYADVMKFFLIAGLMIFLVVTLYIDYFKLFIGSDFRGGVGIVPVILMAVLIMGAFFNLSVWYKLTNKTMIGARLVLIGAVITIVVNVLFIPKYGYYASAWGHLLCYSVMVFLSWFWSRKHFRIPYDFSRILFYFAIIVSFFFIDRVLSLKELALVNYVKPIMILVAVLIFYRGEKKTFLKYKSGEA
ncbi:oligosaccharide flippase family protein [Bacteroidota bacterium]